MQPICYMSRSIESNRDLIRFMFILISILFHLHYDLFRFLSYCHFGFIVIMSYLFAHHNFSRTNVSYTCSMCVTAWLCHIQKQINYIPHRVSPCRHLVHKVIHTHLTLRHNHILVMTRRSASAHHSKRTYKNMLRYAIIEYWAENKGERFTEVPFGTRH